ncbi:MAG: TonB-dependent receptor [Tannerellaceae bacterium]|jgi:TonB-linked SusC/RagA family outer membrane protein|nr:TonB-dependent receptor [Tannerellaceae bacterium]
MGKRLALLYIVVVWFTTIPVWGQVTGVVTDVVTGEPLIGVNVSIGGTLLGTVTDIDGEFTISPEDYPVVLTVSYIGYKTREVKAEAGVPLKIALEEDVNALNEVVVVGYGTQKKREISGSVASVSRSSLSVPVVSLDNLLSGAVSGVQVTQSSGQPGASSSIRIRGGNSITGGNEPLYVIDGFILYNDNANTQTGIEHAGSGVNALATINPSDIESMEILKDASATAIYGSRGANGVILISTRQGKRDRSSVSYTATVGWQEIARSLDLLNARQWAEVRNDISATLGQTPAFSSDDLNALGKGSDWQAAAFQKGAYRDHRISINGGGEKTQYAISGNYYGQEGILLSTGFTRYSLRSNFRQIINERFRIGLNITTSYSKQSGVGNVLNSTTTPNTFVSILQSAPVAPIYNEDGSYNHTNPYTTGNGTITSNPIADLTETINDTKVQRTLANFSAEYRLLTGLTLKLQSGADLISAKQNYYAPYFVSSGLSTNGYASVGARETLSWQAEFTATYDKTVDRHALNLLAGYTTQRTDSERVLAVATNFLSDLTAYHSLQSGSAGLPSSSAITSILNSWLGRANYTYRQRYNASLSLRADGSSRFAQKKKWGYFPSLGFAWNVQEEDFLKAIKDIDNLKLRLSVGSTGNQEIGDYQALAIYTPVLYSFGGVRTNGYAPSNLPNPNLKWETTTQYNAGIDLNLFNSRLSFIFDTYYKKTSDLLLNVPIPTSSGYETVLSNIGSISNTGVELTAQADILRPHTDDAFRWRASLTLAHNKNNVLSLGDQIAFFTPIIPHTALTVVAPFLVKPGESLGTFWGYKTDGIVQTGDDLSAVPKPSWINGDVQPGDRKYIDTNHDGLVNGDDRVILGSNQPFLTGGLTNTLSYGNVDLLLVFQGSYGNKLYNALKQQLEITTLSTNVLSAFARRWTPSNPSNDVPRATSSPVAVVTDRNIEDASYLRLRNLTLGYTFPERLLKPLALSKLRLFFTAQNLLTLTPYSGYDPEANSFESSNLYHGVDYGAYPASRNYLFGLELSF